MILSLIVKDSYVTAGCTIMSKHTQGPWQQEENGNAIEISSSDFNVCIVQLGAPDDEAQARADARLIAAAPDMLVLLARAASHIDDLVVDHPQIQSDPLSDEITQFIAKVTQS